MNKILELPGRLIEWCLNRNGIWLSLEKAYVDYINRDITSKRCMNFYGLDRDFCQEVYTKTYSECTKCASNTGRANCYLLNTCDIKKWFE